MKIYYLKKYIKNTKYDLYNDVRYDVHVTKPSLIYYKFRMENLKF